MIKLEFFNDSFVKSEKEFSNTHYNLAQNVKYHILDGIAGDLSNIVVSDIIPTENDGLTLCVSMPRERYKVTIEKLDNEH